MRNQKSRVFFSCERTQNCVAVIAGPILNSTCGWGGINPPDNSIDPKILHPRCNTAGLNRRFMPQTMIDNDRLMADIPLSGVVFGKQGKGRAIWST
jgi:hypothetical protein